MRCRDCGNEADEGCFYCAQCDSERWASLEVTGWGIAKELTAMSILAVILIVIWIWLALIMEWV